MTIARRLLVDRSGAGLYHCVSRCVRRAFLCGDGFDHRKDWIRNRLQRLSEIFAIDVAAYAVMNNHMHVVVRTDPAQAAEWSALEVARRWSRLFPRDVKVRTRTLTPEDRRAGRSPDGEPVLPLPESAIETLAADASRIAILRDRLSDLSWFMKCLKEPVARRANREDACTGAFWEERFKSIALLDDAAVLACLVYVDLNVIRAMLASTPEQSDHTSIQDRIHLRQLFEKLKGRRSRAPKRAEGVRRPDARKRAPRSPEDGIWLAPIEQRRGQERRGLLGMSLDEYLLVVDVTGRIARCDKRARIPESLPSILERLEIDARRWADEMRCIGHMFGTAIGNLTSRTAEAARRGTRRVVGALDVYRSTPGPIRP